ncbi:MAG TPA: hypothetical protein VFM21_07120 [Terriglobia bacterium]|nr:hypothetical protein [Terriglobia bacterium]
MIKLSPKTERASIAILGVVSVALVALLLWRVFSNSTPRVNAAQPPSTRDAHAVVRQPAAASAPRRDELDRYNPQLNLALLKQIEDHPLPKTARNPFEYPPPPRPQVEAAAPTVQQPPPPPPPPPIKAIGYSVKPGNIAEAVVADETDIYVVHVGDTFAKRYHVLSIAPDRIDIQDAQTQQTVHLPIAQ